MALAALEYADMVFFAGPKQIGNTICFSGADGAPEMPSEPICRDHW
ncbi:MAG: hypothetical protein JWQ17_2608, partial [Tardiphaga sp.]|nr:hypothetical protein [Tardiphaga sp.]